MGDEERERLADDLAEAQAGAERGDLDRTKRAIDELRVLLPRVVAVFGAASEAHRSAISSLATGLNRIDETERSRELFEALGELVNDAIREVGGDPETLDEAAFEEYLSAHGLAAVVGASAETASRDLDALETLAGQAERRLGPAHPLTLWMLSLRAQQRARFDGVDGLDAFDMLIARALTHGDGSLLHLRAIADKATALSRLDFDGESAQLWRRVLEGRRIELGLEDPDTLDAWFWLARTLAWSENAVEAADELDRLIPAMERALGRDADDTLEAMRFRVRVLRRLADESEDPRSGPEHLLELLREILGRETVLAGPDAETPLRTRFEIIELLRENDQTEDALTAATAVREDAVRALGRTAVLAVEAGLREQRLLQEYLNGNGNGDVPGVGPVEGVGTGDARERAALLAEDLCDAAEEACREALQRPARREELRIRGRALAEAWILRADWRSGESQEVADLFAAGAARIDELGVPFRVDAIRLYDRLAGLLISLERPADALPPAERSLRLEQDEYARLAAGDPDPAGEAELRGSATRIAQSLENVGIALRRMGRAVDAEPRLRAGIAEAVATGASPGALDDLRTLHALTLQELDRFDEAAVELREIAERSDDPRRAIDLAVVYLNADRPHEVETLLNPVRDRLERDGRLETPTGLSVLGNLALAVCQLDRHAEAIAQWDRLYELQVRVLGALNRDTLKTLNNRALEELHLGRYAESARRFERVVQQRTEALGRRSPETIGALANLARAVRLSGDLARAKQLSEQVVAESREVLGATHPETLGRIRELDRVLEEIGRSAGGSAGGPVGAEALAAERRELAEGVTAALAADAASADPADPHAAGVRALRYADHLRNLDRLADALVEYTRARDGLAGDPGLDWLAAERGIADCHRLMHAYREAADSYARLVPQIERLLPQDPWALADALDQQSFALAQLNRTDELVPPQERAIAIAERQADRPEQEIKYRTWLGRRLAGRGQHGLALAVYREAAERSEALLGERHRLTLDLFDDVAEALIATGRDREALRVYRRNLPRMVEELGANANPVKRAIASRDAAAKRASRPIGIAVGVIAAATIIIVAVLNLPH